MVINFYHGAENMKRKVIIGLVAFLALSAGAQTVINQGGYDSKSLVDTNSTSTINTNNVNSGTITKNKKRTK